MYASNAAGKDQKRGVNSHAGGDTIAKAMSLNSKRNWIPCISEKVSMNNSSGKGYKQDAGRSVDGLVEE